MASDWLADDAYQAFKAERVAFDKEKDNNEATTRMRVIDQMLFAVLRWDRSAVTPETHVANVGFLDYEFGPRPACSMILEAKRDGKAFVLSGKDYPADPVPFGLIKKECPEAAAALTQAQGYANQKGARYSAISNGHQWLLSMTFVPNQSIDERLVFVFESLDAIEKKFRVFFECFSPAAIRANVPSLKLLDARRAPAPKKLANDISGYPVSADRNKLVNTMRGVLQLVWDGVDADQDNEVFLTNCYIPSEPSQDMLRVAHELLGQRAATDELLAATVEPASGKKLLEQRDRADREQPVVILGKIGHGKSTFLKYLRHVAAKDLLHKKYIQIDVNFLNRPVTADEVPGYIQSQVEEQLKKTYAVKLADDDFVRRVLKAELTEFRETPRGKLLAARGQELADAEVAFIETITGDRHRYMSLVMRHIRRSHQKSVAIFFDNLDRRPDALQEQAFLRAATVAADWGAMVFVCLRPGSVQRSQARGVLDTFARRTIVISQPDVGVVLRKRFQYAARFARRELPREAYARASFAPETESALPESARFFDVCDQSIHRNRSLADQYEAVSNGNIRRVMEYVRDVVTSNHLDTHKIIAILNDDGEYVLAEHETLRALIYGSFVHFEPNSSLFTNLFDVRHADPTEHFSRVLLLDYCHRHANSVDKYGFIPLTTIHAYMGNLGYSASHVTEVVDVLFAKKCVEGRDHDEEAPTLGDDVRITSLGSYHMSTLVHLFVYVDAVVVDTPILDAGTRAGLADVQDIRKRLDRARDFVRYLTQQAEHLSDVDARRVVEDIFKHVINDITDIEIVLRQKGR